MSRHRVFFSFEYNKDSWRVAQIRKLCMRRNDFVTTDRNWEDIRLKTDTAIKEWIDEQIAMCDCIVVLIGSTTAYRKWILYEIERAYALNKGIVGIYVQN